LAFSPNEIPQQITQLTANLTDPTPIKTFAHLEAPTLTVLSRKLAAKVSSSQRELQIKHFHRANIPCK